MIDQRIIQALRHPDPDKRKKAVTLLARTRDPEALKHLARVYREDGDPTVRDLARKGGLYIKKHAPAAASPPVPAKKRRAPLPGDLEAEAAEDAVRRPDHMEQPVRQIDRERAKEYLDQAIDYNVRGDNEKAFERLVAAFATNPRLEHDNYYAMNLAATITGKDPETAFERIQQAIDENPKLRKKRQRADRASAGQRSAAGTIMAIAALMLGVVILLGYFLPWFDMSNLRDEQGVTMQQGLSQMQDEMEQALNLSAVNGVADPAMRQFADSIQGLRLSFNGLDATLIALGVRDPMDVLGIQAFMDAMTSVMGMGDLFDDMMDEMETEIVSEPLDYTLPLVPLAGVVAIILGLALLGHASIVARFIGVAVGLLAIIPILHYYLALAEQIAAQNIDVTGELAGQYSTADFMGVGFWLSAAGVVLFALVMIGTVLFPSESNS